MSFLQAEWRKLILINYAVPPGLLKPYLPAGTELDFWDHKCYLSLVGFMFQNTKLLGFKIPFHINFEEVNLRFYVTRDTGKVIKRGVVFIKEIVPKAALTMIANAVYGEHYQTFPMRHLWVYSDDRLQVDYAWRTGGKWHQIAVSAQPVPTAIPDGSEAEFITEHYWGYTKVNSKHTFEYEVTHPKWKHYPVTEFDIDVSFRNSYGNAFAFLKDQTPDSVMLAEGSEITVEKRKKLPITVS